LKVNCQLYALAALTLEQRAPGKHFVGGLVGSIADTDIADEIQMLPVMGIEQRFLGQ
jgi:hypothetical protein